jgi:hypothetical protein
LEIFLNKDNHVMKCTCFQDILQASYNMT